MKAKLMSALPWIIAVMCLLSMLRAHFTPPVVAQKGFSVVETPSGVKIEYKDAACPEVIKVINKEKADKKAKLPEAVKDDPDKLVTAIGSIDPYQGRTTVIVTLDAQTGYTVIDSRREPLPFFRFVNHKELGARWGLGTQGTSFEVYGEWTFVCISRFCTSLYAELNGGSFKDSELKAMLQGAIEF